MNPEQSGERCRQRHTSIVPGATVTVTRGTLTEKAVLDGELGYGPEVPFLVKAQGTITWLPAPGTTIELDGPDVHVAGLDAIDGTPVLDIKPYMTEFGVTGSEVRQPEWATELMRGYY
ncbi:hypothetical protein SRB5_70950 [Streptomyces sp. RB5]|uniref:TsaA-like domain-containing protein n=1 Tax=Streptomyces smaragdinus TaxID=2585196 RepID=A0A7K0CV81_9ACTN|nr:TrmO family methyltransferase [Streptomyces smaragdinus]MQY16892.1 hypothetical protein [Streptomyces smaragdinus]